eukprot:314329-Prorocentrum_minimum.AAC.1
MIISCGEAVVKPVLKVGTTGEPLLAQMVSAALVRGLAAKLKDAAPDACGGEELLGAVERSRGLDREYCAEARKVLNLH